MGASDMTHHPLGYLVAGERISGIGCTSYSDMVYFVFGHGVRGTRKGCTKHPESHSQIWGDDLEIFFFFHLRTGQSPTADCVSCQGSSTGVVATTPPVVKRPVHRHFRRKREEGSSFLKYMKLRHSNMDLDRVTWF